MKNVIYILFFVFATTLLAEEVSEYYKIITDANNAAVACVQISTPKKHTLVDNEYKTRPSIIALDIPYKYWKKSNNVWVEMDQAEKDAVDDAIAGEESDYSKWSLNQDVTVEVMTDFLNDIRTNAVINLPALKKNDVKKALKTKFKNKGK